MSELNSSRFFFSRCPNLASKKVLDCPKPRSQPWIRQKKSGEPKKPTVVDRSVDFRRKVSRRGETRRDARDETRRDETRREETRRDATKKRRGKVKADAPLGVSQECMIRQRLTLFKGVTSKRTRDSPSCLARATTCRSSEDKRFLAKMRAGWIGSREAEDSDQSGPSNKQPGQCGDRGCCNAESGCSCTLDRLQGPEENAKW